MGGEERGKGARARGTGPEFVVVGRVGRPHGTKGDVLVRSLTDRPEGAFASGVALLPGDAEGHRPEPGTPPLRVSESRPYRKGLLVRFEGFEGRDGAEVLRDRYLLRPFAETEPLEEGEVFHHQLLGLSVVTVEGREVGRIREVYDLNPASLLEVEGEGGAHLIPFRREFLVRLSLEEGRLVIDPPEGLLDL